ncbi:uncharacterized protein BO66DRAFT_293466, partial [Aspergillus aculeatinus CBS 121060]
IPLTTSQTLNIVAHQDDDLLFLSPDLLHNIQLTTLSTPTRTIFLTAGDAGDTSSYWTSRQAGSLAAYARMANAPNTWTESTLSVPDTIHAIPLYTLTANPSISLAFLQLPDGNLHGEGFPTTGNVSLQQLWQEKIPSISSLNPAQESTYTRDTLLSTLSAAIASFNPVRVDTLDFTRDFDATSPSGGGSWSDHSDHLATARFAQAAAQDCAAKGKWNTEVVGYMGYPVLDALPQSGNVRGAELVEKQLVFYTYALSDWRTCRDDGGCKGGNEEGWLARQIVVSSSPGTMVASAQVVAKENGDGGFGGRWGFVRAGDTVELTGEESNGALQYRWKQVEGVQVQVEDAESPKATVTVAGVQVGERLGFELVVIGDGGVESTPARVSLFVVPGEDVAPRASNVTASSENAAGGQSAAKAVDGRVGGYPGDTSMDWATVGGREGSWWRLEWDSPHMISQVYLFDRPNTLDQVTGGVVEFDDGSSTVFAALSNYGEPNSVNFEQRSVHALTVRVTSVSSTTGNVGLAEVKVF